MERLTPDAENAAVQVMHFRLFRIGGAPLIIHAFDG
jgi:hypothetical protein